MIQIDSSASKLHRSVARCIAQDIYPLAKILEMHRISADGWEEMSKSPAFQALLAEELLQWGGAPNAAERVRIKSLAIIEELLPDMYATVTDKDETLSGRVELFKTLAKMANVGAPEDAGGGGPRVNISITVGNTEVTKSANVIDAVALPAG